MKVVKIKNIIIGKGDPKLCISIVGKTKEEIKKELFYAANKKIDLLEWRLDFFTYNQWEHVEEILTLFHRFVKELPLLCTFRTKVQGGQKDIDKQNYYAILYKMMTNSYIDIIDIEYSENNSTLHELISQAHYYHKKVLLSYHNFQKTYSYKDCISLWQKMQTTKADILKVAFMPKIYNDVFILMKATFYVYIKCLKQPMIAISMSSLGKSSRICNSFIGSSIIFVTLETSNSLGQPNLYETHWMLRSFRKLINK